GRRSQSQDTGDPQGHPLPLSFRYTWPEENYVKAMRFDSSDDSTSNVEDRRGLGGGRGIRLGLGGFILLGLLSLVFRRNFFTLVDRDTTSDPRAVPGETNGARAAREESLKQVAVRSFNDAQRFFTKEVGERKHAYRDAKLVLFWDETRSG